jgi:hypothetical protein
MLPAGFEPTIPASERPHTDAVDRGYIVARSDTTQQTNICLGIHRQACVATFKPRGTGTD